MGVLDINSGSKVVVSLEESYAICIGDLACDAQLNKGAIVVLKRDGTGVTPALYATDKPFGMVTVGNRIATGVVTVQTKLMAVVRGISQQTMVVGNELAANGYNATTGQTIYKKAVQGDYIVGIALSAVTGVGDVQVGLYRQPYLETATVGS